MKGVVVRLVIAMACCVCFTAKVQGEENEAEITSLQQMHDMYLYTRDWLNRMIPFQLALEPVDVAQSILNHDFSFQDRGDWFYHYTVGPYVFNVPSKKQVSYEMLGVYENLKDGKIHIITPDGKEVASYKTASLESAADDSSDWLYWELHKRCIVLWFRFEQPQSATKSAFQTLAAYPPAAPMMMRAPSYSEFNIALVRGPADGLETVELTVGIPSWFTNRVDIFSYDGDLKQASNGWQVAASGLIAGNTNEIQWIEADQLGRTAYAQTDRRYYRAVNSDKDSDGDGYSDAYECLVLGTSPNDGDTDNDHVSDGPFDPDGIGSIKFGPDAFPLDANYASDADCDGIADSIDPDIDGDGVVNAIDPKPIIPSVTAPFKTVAVINTNSGSADSGEEVFDLSSAGRMLPYAEGGNAIAGFGRIYGGIYFNHDGTNLYVGVAGYSKTEATDGDDALLIVLDTKSGGVAGLNAISTGPRGLSVCDNLRFQSGTFEPDVALLLGNRNVDGHNDISANIGGKEYGQGVYALTAGSATHLAPAFSQAGPSPISQWGDTPFSTNLANAGIEVAIPLNNLLDVAWSSSSTTIIYAAAIVLGGDNGSQRWLSTEAYGASASGTFGNNNTVLIGAPVYLSPRLAPEPNTNTLFNDSDVMIQAFGWNTPHPLECYYSSMSVAGTFNSWNPAINNMVPVGDDTWEFTTVFTNETGTRFKFAANGSWANQWGETNQTDTTISITNQHAEWHGGDIVLSGTVDGPVRFRFNNASQLYSVESVSTNYETTLLAGFSDVYWYEQLEGQAESNEFDKFTRIWMPPPQKARSGRNSTGYDPFDYYDLGTYDQKGAVVTRYGMESQLKNCMNAFAARGIDCMADMVLNHMNGGNPYRYDYEYSSHDTFPKVNNSATDTNEYFNVNYTDFPFCYDHGFGLPEDVHAWDAYPTADSADVNELHPYMRNNIKSWANWLESKVSYRGCRFDFTQGMQPGFFAEFMNTPLMKGRFAVAEYWTDLKDASAREHETWIHLMDKRSCSFDMPLHEKLTKMCNEAGLFNMEKLSYGALIHSCPEFAVTFVESHDSVRPFKEGGKVGIETNKELAYAFILFSEGHPCVFYQDYFGQPYADKESETGWVGNPKELKPYIDAMIDVREKYAGGTTTYLSTANKTDLFIAKRNGTEEKDGCIIVLNDNISSSLTNTADTGWSPGTIIVDALDTNHIVTVQTDGMAPLSAPNRGFRVFVRRQSM